MPLTKKTFKIMMSKKMVDGSLLMVEYATEIEKDTDDPAALFDECAKSTYDDMKASFEKCEYSKSVLKQINRLIKNEKRVEEAESV